METDSSVLWVSSSKIGRLINSRWNSLISDDSAGLAMLSFDERLQQSMLSDESPSFAMYPCDFDRFRILGNRKNIHPALAAVAAISVCACIDRRRRNVQLERLYQTVADYLDGEGHSGLDRSTLGGSDAKEMFVHGSGSTCTASLQPELLVGGVLLRGLWNGDVNVDVGFVQGVGPLPVLISRRARLLRSAASRSSGAANITNIRSG